MYEGDRLVKTVTVREPEYRPEDLSVLLSWLRDDLEPRGSHGHLLADAMSPDADPGKRDAKYRFVAGPPVVDFAAKALADRQAAYLKQFPDADMSYLRWSVERRER